MLHALMCAYGVIFFALTMAMSSSDMPDPIEEYNIERTRWADIDEKEYTQRFLIESLDKIRESSVKNYDEENLLFFSAKFDELLKYTKFLLKNGAKPNRPFKGTLPLHNAIRNGALKSAYLLAQSGAECKKALLPLMDTFCYAHDEQTFAAQKSLFDLMVKKGARVNAVEKQTLETPLWKVLRVKFSLLPDGKVTFHEIPLKQRTEFVQLLLNNNANAQAVVQGKTPLQRACANGFTEIAAMLKILLNT